MINAEFKSFLEYILSLFYIFKYIKSKNILGFENYQKIFLKYGCLYCMWNTLIAGIVCSAPSNWHVN